MTDRGRLVPLKTLYELEVRETLVEAYVVEFPVKLASQAVNHLRHDVKPHDDYSTIHLIIPPPLPAAREDIVAALRPYIDVEGMPVIRVTQVPCEAPTTAEQAVQWSNKYWPCIFSPASQVLQKAPPLHVLRAVSAELDDGAKLASYFGLAHIAALQCSEHGFGRQVAAVVVNPANGEVVAVAGDARWYSPAKPQCSSDSQAIGLAEGRPEQHALMRTIAMVAAKDQRRITLQTPHRTTEADSVDLAEKPLTPIEAQYAVTTDAQPATHHPPSHNPPTPQSQPRPDAYLCTGLDLYCTHEPCVACSMAMLHSRFRTCIFRTRMPRSGGLWAEKAEADGGLGYGLFWRRELNWRVLTFRYLAPDESKLPGVEGRSGHCRGDDVEEAMFHA